MLILLSPSKSLSFDAPLGTHTHTTPDFLAQSEQLIAVLRQMSASGLRQLMGISEALAELNAARYHAFSVPFSLENARPAIFTFTGDVYTDFHLSAYDDADFAYLQDHVRILSGLYGLLRPLDLIQAYRLEMGIKLANPNGKNLYEFWGNTITEAVQHAAVAQHHVPSTEASDRPIIVQLASNEYAKSVRLSHLDARVIQVGCKDLKNGKYKTISFYLKRFRGAMADWIVRNRIQNPQDLRSFCAHNYRFSEVDSTADHLMFLRDERPE